MNQFDSTEKQSPIGIVMINGSCCMPSLTPIEHQVRHIIDKVIAETGVSAQVGIMSLTQAAQGGVTKEILNDGMIRLQQGGLPPLPVVLVNGKVASYGVPDPEVIRSVLLQASAANNTKEL
jgi:hypothetical protein